jgi:hypothetical protein
MATLAPGQCKTVTCAFSMIRRLGPAALLVTGCGAGVPLLHAPHPLDPGELSLGAGFSGQMVRGPMETRLSIQEQDESSVESTDRALGAVLRATQAASLAPWMGARVGIGNQSDVGLTYTGREVRTDAQYAWTFGAWAVSAGAGFGVIFSRQPRVDEEGAADGRARADTQTGFGLDVPLLVGWRSTPDVVQAWTGLRGGYERLGGNLHLESEASESTSSSLDATVRRWYIGPVLGASVGVEPVWVTFELAAAYQLLRGDLREIGSAASPDSSQTPSQLPDPGRIGFAGTGYALVPSAALLARF